MKELEMNPTLTMGTRLVAAALLFYSLAFWPLQKKKVATKLILSFQSLGLVLDISATLFMILGSKNSPFTFHGVLGYSALLLMVIKTVFVLRSALVGRFSQPITSALSLCSRIAYGWWVIAFIVGGLMVLLK